MIDPHGELREIDVHGTPVRWFEAGVGFPVVLVHGIPTSPALWRHVTPLVRARTLAFEMTGYGSSTPLGDGRDISVAAQARRLVDWLRVLEIDRAVFVGHDLGGGVVQIAAVDEPELCGGIVLTNAVGYDSWPIPSVKALRAAAPLVARLPLPAFRLLLRTFFLRGHDDAACEDEAFRAHWPHYEAHGGAAAMVRQMRALDVQDTLAVADRLPSLSVPARVVWGAADQFQKVGYGERFARDLGVEVQRIPGGKHWTPEDHAAVIAAAVNDVVAEAGRTG